MVTGASCMRTVSSCMTAVANCMVAVASYMLTVASCMVAVVNCKVTNLKRIPNCQVKQQVVPSPRATSEFDLIDYPTIAFL